MTLSVCLDCGLDPAGLFLGSLWSQLMEKALNTGLHKLLRSGDVRAVRFLRGGNNSSYYSQLFLKKTDRLEFCAAGADGLLTGPGVPSAPCVTWAVLSQSSENSFRPHLYAQFF